MSEQYRIHLRLNQPPKTEGKYERGDSLDIAGDSWNEIFLVLAEQLGSAAAAAEEVSRFFDERPVATVTPLPTAAPEPVVQTGNYETPPVQYAPVAQVPPPVLAPTPAPQATPGAATPGIEYPDASKVGGNLIFGAPCPKCSVTTYWQPPGNHYQTGKPFDGYWRCANQKNHPKAG